ncbi:MAG TPA: hypothetical protein VKF17_06655 [Isosphaeraceae bacterium]|nr:hypothetical protein [Isosphaeraceae bacterium]
MKSCSRSHSILGFVFIILFHVLLLLLALGGRAMGTHVYIPPDVAGVILWILRG